MENKLGLYINNLMTTIVDEDERNFTRKLAFEELQKINHDIGEFLIKFDEILNDEPEMKIGDKNYKDFWTCSFCGKHTYEVDYDYLSGTDHLDCVLEQEKKEDEENQLKFNFGDSNENK
tara:strand:- start:917 stop:1273 length:357 start_codon:yes stop_codon:yes gene_type:complete